MVWTSNSSVGAEKSRIYVLESRTSGICSKAGVGVEQVLGRCYSGIYGYQICLQIDVW